MPLALRRRPLLSRRELTGALLIAVLLSLALTLVAAPARVRAQAPQLTERVTDQTGRLSAADTSTAEAGIKRLEDQHNIQLWALFVGSTGGTSAPDYATEVADANGLGGNDALLVVAIDDRRDAIWVGPLLDSVTNDELDTILANSVEPRLQEGAWGQAVADGASALGNAAASPAGGGGGGNGGAVGGTTNGPAPADFGWLAWVIGIVLILVGLVLVWSWFSRWRATHREAEERDRQTGELARKANALLIQTDELLRQDEQELGFAEAEFGTDAVQTFRNALGQARTELQAAFKVRQQLDDDVPEDATTRAAMLNEIVARCTRAQDLVDKETDRFRELRDLERRAPEILAALPDQLAKIEGRLSPSEAQLGALEQSAASSAATVRGNVAEARKRIAIAREAVQGGTMASGKGDRAAASRAAKAAQDAAAQATTLLDAVTTARQALDDAREHLSAALDQARTDIAAAHAAVGDASDASDANLAQADAKMAQALQAASGQSPDLVLAYRLAKEAEAAADALVAKVKQDEERRAKAVAAADSALSAATRSVQRADDFITARRHGVGRIPRTRLADAHAALDQARASHDADPETSATSAQQAIARADEAYQLASQEFDETDASGNGGTVIINGQPYPVGRGSRWPGQNPGPSWGQEIGGAILGGIIGSILSGGGGWGRGGGFGPRGGGMFGGGGGFGGFGGGGGRSIGGGFGGFGGGGGRSRGGGW